MKEQICFHDFADISFGAGEIRQQTGYVLYVVWAGGICLKAIAYRYEPYYVIIAKENTELQCVCCHTKEALLSHVRNFARDIEAGRYRNKKTYREQARQIVQERNLTSYMNTTKWKKFLHIVYEKLPFRPDFVYKTLFDEPDREDIQSFSAIPRSQGCYCPECFPQHAFWMIEWIRLMPKYAVNTGGYLVEHLEIHDETQELLAELEKAHIPYVLHQQEVLIYGYR